MATYENKVREVLLQNGCRFVRHGKGDHDIYYDKSQFHRGFKDKIAPYSETSIICLENRDCRHFKATVFLHRESLAGRYALTTAQ